VSGKDEKYMMAGDGTDSTLVHRNYASDRPMFEIMIMIGIDSRCLYIPEDSPACLLE
jgi:hypothetical protein